MSPGDEATHEGKNFQLCTRCIRPSSMCWAARAGSRPVPARFPEWVRRFRPYWGDEPTLPRPDRLQRAYCVFGRIAATRSTAAETQDGLDPSPNAEGVTDLTLRLAGLYLRGVRPWQEELDHWAGRLAPLASRILRRLPTRELRQYWVEQALRNATGELLLTHPSLFWLRWSLQAQLTMLVEHATVQIRDHLRKDRRRLTVLPPELRSSKATPLREAEAEETRLSFYVAVTEALAALAPRQRRVLVGAAAGRTQGELGRELGCSQQLIARLLDRSLDRFRQVLVRRLGGAKVAAEKMDFFPSREAARALVLALL